MRGTCRTWIALSCVLVCHHALAQSPPRPPATPHVAGRTDDEEEDERKGPPTKETQARRAFRDGQAQFYAKEFVAAEKLFHAARNLLPERPKPYYWLGITLIELGNCSEAVKYLQDFLSIAPGEEPHRAEALAAWQKCEAQPKQAPAPIIVAPAPTPTTPAVPMAPKPAAPATPPATQPTQVSPKAVVVPPVPKPAPPPTLATPATRPAPPPIAPSTPKRVAAPSAPVAVPVPAPAALKVEASASMLRTRYAGFALMATGLLGGVAGGVGFGVAKPADACVPCISILDTAPPVADETKATNRNLLITSVAVGGTAIIIGAALVVWSYRSEGPRARAWRVTPVPLPNGGAITLTRQF